MQEVPNMSKNLQRLVLMNRGRAVANNSIEQGAVGIPHPCSFLNFNLFYRDHLQVEGWNPGLSQVSVCNSKKQQHKELNPINTVSV